MEFPSCWANWAGSDAAVAASAVAFAPAVDAVQQPSLSLGKQLSNLISTQHIYKFCSCCLCCCSSCSTLKEIGLLKREKKRDVTALGIIKYLKQIKWKENAPYIRSAPISELPSNKSRMVLPAAESWQPLRQQEPLLLARQLQDWLAVHPVWEKE